jgi:sugar (pentulose or hexulose) kinase
MNHPTPVIAVFDIGKTNKKLILFDEDYRIVFETATRLTETNDADGFPCENRTALAQWVQQTLNGTSSLEGITIKAINVSAYGASFVYLDEKLTPIGELTNYLKPYPDNLMDLFLAKHDPHHRIFQETSSPKLGNLNSGLQLFRMKYEQPEHYQQVRYALHLPQFISFLFSGKVHSELTTIGCHTLLWDFQKKRYHDWVKNESIDKLFPSVVSCDHVDEINHGAMKVGVGMHDSSAALLPYLRFNDQPFLLISTGTWCITLNPFNDNPLTAQELDADCLCYLSVEGKPVKAARLFAGHEHDVMVQKIAAHFNVSSDLHRSVRFQPALFNKFGGRSFLTSESTVTTINLSAFSQRELSAYSSFEEAYHQLMMDLVRQQYISTQLVLKDSAVKRIYVDGGFSNNEVFMNLLTQAFPDHEVFGASIPQASAIGAALAIHQHWNSKPVRHDLIQLKGYPNQS